jgi:hypothetical protein
LRPDFHADSDIDVLVEFEADRIPGLFGMARAERELSVMLGGRKVDMRTPEDLSRYFRQKVLWVVFGAYIRQITQKTNYYRD